MKRTLTFIITLVSLLCVQAQLNECVRIYTDKDCYLTGESLWIKICITDSLYIESTLSQVAYVEVSDTKQMHAQAKIALKNGTGWGHVKFPQTMHSGTYMITAYTRYMRNRSDKCFPKKYIAVLNTTNVMEEDEVELVDSISVMPDVQENFSSHFTTDKSVYGSRSKVNLNLPQLPADIHELTLSVVRKDCMIPNFPLIDYSPKESLLNSSDNRFAAECEGHIVSGRLIGTTTDSVNARLACVGQDMQIFEGRKKSDDTYSFYTTEIKDMQDIVLTALPEKKLSCRLEIVSPFAKKLPERLPKLRLAYEEKDLIERSIGAQLYHLLPVNSTQKRDISEQLHDYHPTASYNLDEYVRFNTVRETITEFILEVRTSNYQDESFIRVIHKDNQRFSDLKALVLLDGVPIENHESVLNYNARLLHYIHQYSGKYTFGGKIYDGIVSLHTHKGTFPHMRLDDNSQMFSYEFPQNRPNFVTPEYSSETSTVPRIPDFRHTLYWNPDITPDTKNIVFYTSDMKGTYIMTLQGITSNGKAVKFENQFIVE